MLHQLDKQFGQFLESIWLAELQQLHVMLGFVGITERRRKEHIQLAQHVTENPDGLSNN